MTPEGSDAPLTLAPGDQVAGAYRVERVIGQGAMGLVVAAESLARPGEVVALKLLAADQLERGEALARFEREVRLLRQLRSPHVAAVLDAGFHDQHIPFMAIELLEGHDLEAELTSRGPLPLTEVVDLALEVLDALVEAHGHGIVHRDLKPSNLFLSRTADGGRTLKVLDFGISKPQGGAEPVVSLTKTHSLIGSPLYMAPEQVLAAREVDGRADVWSLGVVMFELLAGITPFDGNTVGVVLGNVMSAPIPSILARRPDLPPAFAGVLTACFERTPSRRLSSLDLARALGPFASTTGAAALARINRLAVGIRLTPDLGPPPPLTGTPPATPVSLPPSSGPFYTTPLRQVSPFASTEAGGSFEPPATAPVSSGDTDPAAIEPSTSKLRGPLVALLIVTVIVAAILVAARMSPG